MKFVVFLAPLFLTAGSALACPDLNGTYVNREDGMTRTVQIRTRRETGRVLYRLGEAGFLPADGEQRRIETGNGVVGTVRVRCEGSTVTILSRQAGGESLKLELTRVGEDRLLVSGDGDGEYVRAHN